MSTRINGYPVQIINAVCKRSRSVTGISEHRTVGAFCNNKVITVSIRFVKSRVDQFQGDVYFLFRENLCPAQNVKQRRTIAFTQFAQLYLVRLPTARFLR